ncbi:MAG: phosphate transport system permease protein [Actinomycetota bacterium]|jgi:phosphate transport system permease protein|nr:phosphate transport system permease protein [Actinomycetota bacterium]
MAPTSGQAPAAFAGTAAGIPDDVPRHIRPGRTVADRVYRGASMGGGLLTLFLLVLIGWFLLREGLPELRKDGWHFITGSQWTAVGPFGIWAVMYWTVVIALIGLVLALPLSIAMALFINEYSPPGARRVFTSLIDLLAAVPSLIYGIWGLIFLQPHLLGVSKWLTTHLSFVPIFKTTEPSYKASSFIAGVVVALMIVPIITSVTREVFSQAPPGEKEAALAMGATRWGMIRTVVLPFGKGGIIGGAMLGLGRALGETIVVVLIISPIYTVNPHILQSGSNSVASLIALQIGDAHGIAVNALMAAGLALFVLTLMVNMVAAVIVGRSRSGRGTEI